MCSCPGPPGWFLVDGRTGVLRDGDVMGLLLSVVKTPELPLQGTGFLILSGGPKVSHMPSLPSQKEERCGREPGRTLKGGRRDGLPGGWRRVRQDQSGWGHSGSRRRQETNETPGPASHLREAGWPLREHLNQDPNLV